MTTLEQIAENYTCQITDADLTESTPDQIADALLQAMPWGEPGDDTDAHSVTDVRGAIVRHLEGRAPQV